MPPTFPLILLVTAVDVHHHFRDDALVDKSYILHGFAVSKNSPSICEMTHILLCEAEMDYITSAPLDLKDYILELSITKSGEIVGGIIDDTCKTK